MVMELDHNRRRLLAAAAAGLILSNPRFLWAAELLATPRQTPGPFYPDKTPLEDDNDLTRVAGAQQPALGTVTDLRGRLLNANGQPIAKARIEIWQCDANGRYHHQDDRRNANLDPGFQGFGSTVTDAEGAYRFRTIRPVAYSGRTPHIHFKVIAPGNEPLTTQMYVAGEARNAEDFLYQRLEPAERERVTVAFTTASETPKQLATRFNIILG